MKTYYLQLAALALTALVSLSACDKTTKQSTAGGGSSTQSVMSIKGAAR